MIHSEKFEAISEDAKSRVKEISVEDTKAKLDAGEKIHFIDVREDREWNEGHAAGATHLGRGVIERDIHNLVQDPDEAMILYCGGGYRSALAADNLQKMGYTNILSMAGGIKAWRAAQYPEEKP